MPVGDRQQNMTNMTNEKSFGARVAKNWRALVEYMDSMDDECDPDDADHAERGNALSGLDDLQ